MPIQEQQYKSWANMNRREIVSMAIGFFVIGSSVGVVMFIGAIAAPWLWLPFGFVTYGTWSVIVRCIRELRRRKRGL